MPKLRRTAFHRCYFLRALLHYESHGSGVLEEQSQATPHRLPDTGLHLSPLRKKSTQTRNRSIPSEKASHPHPPLQKMRWLLCKAGHFGMVCCPICI